MKFFTDHTGKYSSQRLFSFMIILAGISQIMLPLLGNLISGSELYNVDWPGASAIITLGLSGKLLSQNNEKEKKLNERNSTTSNRP